MNPVINTPRLKLTLVTHTNPGSDELKWLHELRSDKQATAWSISPPSTSIEDTLKHTKPYIPDPAATEASHKIAYAVHTIETTNSTAEKPHFIGLITLKSPTQNSLPLPPHLVNPAAPTPRTHTGGPETAEPATADLPTVELAYSFLPTSWGHGYATESLTAVLSSLSCNPGTTTTSHEKETVWMRVIVNGRNGPSLGVMRKLARLGVREMGVYVWSGEAIFIGGEWRTVDELVIFGMRLSL